MLALPVVTAAAGGVVQLPPGNFLERAGSGSEKMKRERARGGEGGGRSEGRARHHRDAEGRTGILEGPLAIQYMIQSNVK